jgi:hypothetical protein
MRSIGLVLVLLLGLAGCAGSEDEDENGQLLDLVGTDLLGDVGSGVTYAEVSGFLDARCNWCHSTALSGNDRQGAPLRYNYNTYAAAKAGGSEGLRTVLNGSMPPAIPIGPEEKAIFQAWVVGGMLP